MPYERWPGAPVQALSAGLATWLLTAARAAVVVFFREFPGRLIAPMLGFAAGVMTARFWSLLYRWPEHRIGLAAERSTSLSRLSAELAASGGTKQ